MIRASVVCLLLPVQATAAPAYCASRQQIAERLEAKYQEHQIGGGFQSTGPVIEVWTSADGSTWTILQTRPDGISCVMATGTDWFTAKPTPAGTLN